MNIFQCVLQYGKRFDISHFIINGSKNKIQIQNEIIIDCQSKNVFLRSNLLSIFLWQLSYPAVFQTERLSFMQTRRLKFFELFRFGLGGCRNILLAATAEGLACTFRIPIGNESEHVKHLVNAPYEYEFTCFLAIGYAAEDANICKQKDVRLEGAKTTFKKSHE